MTTKRQIDPKKAARLLKGNLADKGERKCSLCGERWAEEHESECEFKQYGKYVRLDQTRRPS